jgi:hypothetical protein
MIIYIVFQNDKMLAAFTMHSKARDYCIKKTEDYDGPQIGNNFHIKSIEVDTEP